MSEHARAEREPEAATAPGPSVVAGPATAAALVTRLQRTAGNRAVVRLLARAPAPAPAAETLDEADMEALRAYGEVHQLAATGAGAAESGAAKRAAIVKLALSQVGKVRDEDRGDGKKKGAERLKEFYRVACPSYQPAYDWGIETVGRWAAQTPKDLTKTGKPWSWCAIFGVWAIHQITGVGTFAGKPNGLGRPIYFSEKGARDRVKPGDMIVRREQYDIEGREKDKDPLNHQCLVADVDRSDPKKPMVTTVNGNGPYQSIYVKTEPLSWYSGYYDSLSETADKGY